MSPLMIRFFAGVLLVACARNTVAKEINALVGSSVDLPCSVDTAQCGELHSIRWYQDFSRIYVYSQLGLISRAEGNATKRMSMEYHLKNTEALLKISKVELQDEASYTCEITYLEVNENCDGVQVMKLQTMVEPEPPRIISTRREPHQTITNTTFGPYDEGTEIQVVCEAGGGKPEPIVKWYNGSQEMTKAQYSSITDSEGLSTGTAKLDIMLSRGDLGARYECRVTSTALKEPMVSHLIMDVHVKPLLMKLKFQEQVVQGNDVLLSCKVFGSNPAADVKWFNNSNLITNESLIHTVAEAIRNGTFVTKSHLQFKPTRFDNGKRFHCFAENSVTLNQQDLSFHKQVFIQVKYRPVVTVSPENTTVNESSNENSQDILIRCMYESNPVELKAVYWMKDGKNITLDKEKYEGASSAHPPLYIKNVTRDDMGEYVCICKNEVGASQSENSAILNVQYPPSVEVVLDPAVLVKSMDGVNVTAMCNVTSGNPPSLRTVRWYLGGEMLKELPECNYTSNDVDESGGLYCNVDPSILSLVTVDQSFAGNYTCQGENLFKWGPLSDPTELIVYYPPSPAKLTYSPPKPIKRGKVDLECAVDHPGRPKNLSYIWYRGKHKMSGVTTSKLTINPVKLDTRNNFTCMASNEGGLGEPATVFINVSAAPTFITPLKYQHVRSFQTNMSLTCRVECSPLCYISWFKGYEQIDTRNDRRYDIKTTIRDANGKTGDFESIESTLIWNVDAWDTHPFAKTTPTANYMCMSSSNGIGNGVNASVAVEVEYPPENLTLSRERLFVTEKTLPPTVTCSGKGFPDLRYTWKKLSSGAILSGTQILSFKEVVTKKDSGTYVCEASNIHGVDNKTMELIVEYAPSCVITKGEYNNVPAVLCIVDAVPQDVNFTWRVIHGTNDTMDEQLNTRQEHLRGFLLLDSDVHTVRTYQCIANNSAGVGEPCELLVLESAAAPWWHIFGDSIAVLIAIIAGIILCAIFVCIIIIIIICVCRRRRARNKLPNPSTTADRGRLGVPLNDGSTDPLTNPDKGFYENLPFHGMQTPPNKPYKPEYSDLDYADVDYRSYGPINYKAASIYALAKKNNKNKNKLEDKEYDDLL